MKRIVAMLLASSIFIGPSKAEETDLPLEVRRVGGTIAILSTDKEPITIKKVELNRGNCYVRDEYYPKKLVFGEEFIVSVYDECTAIEVKIYTDKGEKTLTRKSQKN